MTRWQGTIQLLCERKTSRRFASRKRAEHWLDMMCIMHTTDLVDVSLTRVRY